MRCLADESCDFAVVRALRSSGHDVVAVAEEHPGLTDRDVMARAEAEDRVLITEDKDFGQLAFAAGAESVGCLLLRYPVSARSSIGVDIVQAVRACGPRLAGSFVTVGPGRIRITRLPESR